jgi:hypothetical protein
MRRLTLALVAVLALPATLSAQGATSVQMEDLAIQNLSELRRFHLLPNETVGFRVLGGADARNLRLTTGHLTAGRLYHATVTITEVGGTSLRRLEGTVSTDAALIALGDLPDGEYRITVELADMATGATRGAKSRVILR